MQPAGKLRVIVEDSQLKAFLVFEPDPEGEAWSLEGVRNFLKDKKIIEPVDDESLREVVEAFKNAGDSPVERIIARGIPPVSSGTSEYQWRIGEIPEELRKDGEWFLEKACEPHITIKKYERVRVEKSLEKKGGLLLSRSKKQSVQTWETREREEQVPVDPTVLESGWIEKGQILAVVPEGEGGEGKPGRSVYGEVLPPPEGRFYIGKGVTSTGGNLVATHSGFVRRGKNWVEILPFEDHEWSITTSKDRATCFFSFTPGKKDARPPGVEKILESALRQEFTREELLPPAGIQKLLTASIHRGIPLKDYPITRARDAWFEVKASEDKLKGLLSMGKGSGKGKPLVLKEVGGAIKKSRFKDLDFEKIKEVLLDFYKSSRREMRDYVLAEGTPPSRGGRRKLKVSCRFVDVEKLQSLRNAPIPLTGEGDENPIESLTEYPLDKVSRMAFVKVGDEVAAISSDDRGEDGEDVFGSVLPGLYGEDPPIELKENLLSKDDKIIANEDGILDVIEEEGNTLFRVRPYRESRVEVELSGDKMEAYISLEEGRGFAEPLSREWVDRVLAEQNIVRGIDNEVLGEALLQARGGEVVDRLKFAEGSPPEQGGATNRIKFHVRLAAGDMVKIRKDGRADFRNHDEITPVKEGELIAEIPALNTAGEGGWDVTGRPLAAEKAQAVELNIGENIRREEDSDGSVKLYAEKSGELDYDEKNISVHVLHHVKGDVDMHSGNINFPGTVNIKGNVLRGFYVMAGADINVEGTVEGALLSAGGSVNIAQGVAGGNKAVLRAKKDIRAQFIEESTMLSVGDIEIKNSCLRCSVKCNGTFRVIGEKGTLIGGSVLTKHGVVAKNLGNAKGTPTSISFGQDYLIADKIEFHEKEVEQLKEKVTQLDFELRALEQQHRQKKLEQARAEKVKYLKMIEKRTMRLFTLRERYEEHFESEIVVLDTLYPGVVIESHGRRFEVSSPQKGVKIVFNQENGRIETRQKTKEE